VVKGKFITVEGIEGAGKSTIVQFIKQQFDTAKIPCTLTREPGGTPIAESIRQVLLGQHDEMMSPDTELLLMFAGRAQHISQVILPALQRNQWVLCDRFTDASFAYQGGGRGVPLSHIRELAAWVQGDLLPDVTILLDLPVETGFSRITSRGALDRIESEGKDFFERVRERYLIRSKKFPERFRIISADQDLDAVKQDVLKVIAPLMAAAHV
jgi:dTMP kinase